MASQTPSARGAVTLIKVKARHLLTGGLVNLTFKAGQKFSEPDMEARKAQYLYFDGEHHCFMDLESYEQHALGGDQMGDATSYLLDNLELRIVFYEGRPVSVELPHVVEMHVSQCDPAHKGDTVQAATKPATTHGLVNQYPNGPCWASTWRPSTTINAARVADGGAILACQSRYVMLTWPATS